MGVHVPSHGMLVLRYITATTMLVLSCGDASKLAEIGEPLYYTVPVHMRCIRDYGGILGGIYSVPTIDLHRRPISRCRIARKSDLETENAHFIGAILVRWD